jgi:hypothetical protein
MAMRCSLTAAPSISLSIVLRPNNSNGVEVFQVLLIVDQDRYISRALNGELSYASGDCVELPGWSYGPLTSTIITGVLSSIVNIKSLYWSLGYLKWSQMYQANNRVEYIVPSCEIRFRTTVTIDD